jgi:hypothetical protein
LADIEKLRDLIKMKTRLFLDYEAISLNMQPADLEQMAAAISKREELAGQIDAIDKEIKSLCFGQSLLLKAVQNSCNRDELTPMLQPVFDDAQTLYMVINRIKCEEEIITQQMLQVREELLQQLRVSQKTGKIVKYRHAVEPDIEAGSLLSTNNRKA